MMRVFFNFAFYVTIMGVVKAVTSDSYVEELEPGGTSRVRT